MPKRIVFIDYIRVIACFLVLSNVAPLFMPNGPADPILPIYLTIPCMALLTFAISAAITKLISLVPGSKWVIG